MENYRFERAARRRRRKALLLTFLFHLLLIGGIVWSSEGSLTGQLPEVVQEWMGWDANKTAELQPAEEAPQP